MTEYIFNWNSIKRIIFLSIVYHPLGKYKYYFSNNILIETALKQNYLVYNNFDDDLKNKEFTPMMLNYK